MSSVESTPPLLSLSRVVSEVPEAKTKAIVGLAHARLGSASDAHLWHHVRLLFEACIERSFSASQALSLVWGCWVGWECKSRGLSAADLWSQAGKRAFDAVAIPSAVESIDVQRPQWWGTRFEMWALQVESDLPSTFRSSIGWAILSALLGDFVATPLGSARVAVGLAGASARSRTDALTLSGTLSLDVETSSLVLLTARSDRLTAVMADEVTTIHALRERQGPPNHEGDRMLALLVSEALDGLERAQAAFSGPLLVESTTEALDVVTDFKVALAERVQTFGPDTMDAALTGTTRLVRSMAALVAVVGGETAVSGSHQAIALDAVSQSLQSLIAAQGQARSIA